MDSRGLLLMTNDGELTHRLLHPKYHIPKRYEVLVWGNVDSWKLRKLRQGVTLSDGITRPAEVRKLPSSKSDKGSWLEFVLMEGRHRQIRRMCGALQLEVGDLWRVGFGDVELGQLSERGCRELSKDEVEGLKKAVGLDD